MQKAYFKCAYECFDRTRTHAEISRCAESCSVPITNAQNYFDNEMSVFQVSLFLNFISSYNLRLIQQNLQMPMNVGKLVI